MTGYQKNYHENRKAISIVQDVGELVDDVKERHNFKSYSETIHYLLDLENDLKKNNMIVDKYVCKKCDASIDNMTIGIAKEIHKFQHKHIDHTTDCPGHIRKGYGIKTEQKNATEAKDEHNETTEAKDEHNETTEAKGIMTKEEKAEFLRKYNAGELTSDYL